MHSLIDLRNSSRTPVTFIDLSRARTQEELRADCEANPDLTSWGKTCCLSQKLRRRISTMFIHNFGALPAQILGHFTSALVAQREQIKALNPEMQSGLRHFCAKELCGNSGLLNSCDGGDKLCLSEIFGEGTRGKGGGKASDDACSNGSTGTPKFLTNRTNRTNKTIIAVRRSNFSRFS